MPLYLFARIADEPVAIAAGLVRSVLRPGPLTPVPQAPSHVSGLCALRSRVLTVVDARAALGLGSVETGAGIGIVLEAGGHGYAILVDCVDDVVEADAVAACPAALDPCWNDVSIGFVEHEGMGRLLIDPEALIDGRAIRAA